MPWLDAVSFIASLATIGAIVVALLEYRAQRKDKQESRKNLKATMLAALRTELETIRSAAEGARGDYDKTQYSSPNPEQDQRYFVWMPLPSSTIEQALQEAFLLELDGDQIKALQGLRLQILHTNLLVTTQAGGLPGVEFNERLTRHLNLVIRNRMPQIENSCSVIVKWLQAKEEVR